MQSVFSVIKKEHFMKKIIQSILIAIALSSSLLFASGSTEKKSNSNITNESNPIELSFWHYLAGKRGDSFNKFIDEFNNTNTDNIYITSQFVPRAELMKQYTIGAVSGELPDMGMVDNPNHAAYSSMGIFDDITDLYNSWDEAAFLEGPLNSCKYEGKIYGVPYASNCLALFYDEDLLKKYNLTVPKNWSELEEACKILTDPAKGRYGLAICAIGNEEGTFQFIPFLESSGKFDELDSKESIKSLSFLTELINKGYISKEVINWTQADVEKQFAAGSAAMMINGPWNITNIESDNPSKNWNVALVPKEDNGKYASCLGGENLVICKGANKEASWKFLTWFLSKKVSQRYNYGIKTLSPRSDIDGNEMYKDDPKMALFASVMPSAKPRGPHPRWPEISAAIYTAEQEAFTNQKTPQQAMIDAQNKVNKINSSMNN